jgi:hypothetical protein
MIKSGLLQDMISFAWSLLLVAVQNTNNIEYVSPRSISSFVFLEKFVPLIDIFSHENNNNNIQHIITTKLDQTGYTRL